MSKMRSVRARMGANTGAGSKDESRVEQPATAAANDACITPRRPTRHSSPNSVPPFQSRGPRLACTATQFKYDSSEVGLIGQPLVRLGRRWPGAFAQRDQPIGG